jgi:hypothetical protein
VEILTSQLLHAEYERLSFHIFQNTEQHQQAFHEIKMLFLESEIREKKNRWIKSPYIRGEITGLGTKGLNAVAPIVLSLVHAGKEHLTDRYIEIFLLIGAVIQMVDDWSDLQEDLCDK